MGVLLADPLLRDGPDLVRGLLIGGGLFFFIGLFFEFLAKQFRLRLTEPTPPPGFNTFGWERQRAFARMRPLFRTVKYLALGALAVAGLIIFSRWVSG
jgi:hypothetical protein